MSCAAFLLAFYLSPCLFFFLFKAIDLFFLLQLFSFSLPSLSAPHHNTTTPKTPCHATSTHLRAFHVVPAKTPIFTYGGMERALSRMLQGRSHRKGYATLALRRFWFKKWTRQASEERLSCRWRRLAI